MSLSVNARKNCTTTFVMATEIDYVTLLLCVDMFKCKSEEIMSFGCFFWIFGDCFSGGVFSAIDENHPISFPENYMQLFFFLFLSTGSF
jgi:hypothetical protein